MNHECVAFVGLDERSWDCCTNLISSITTEEGKRKCKLHTLSIDGNNLTTIPIRSKVRPPDRPAIFARLRCRVRIPLWIQRVVGRLGTDTRRLPCHVGLKRLLLCQAGCVDLFGCETGRLVSFLSALKYRGESDSHQFWASIFDWRVSRRLEWIASTVVASSLRAVEVGKTCCTFLHRKRQVVKWVLSAAKEQWLWRRRG